MKKKIFVVRLLSRSISFAFSVGLVRFLPSRPVSFAFSSRPISVAIVCFLKEKPFFSSRPISVAVVCLLKEKPFFSSRQDRFFSPRWPHLFVFRILFFFSKKKGFFSFSEGVENFTPHENMKWLWRGFLQKKKNGYDSYVPSFLFWGRRRGYLSYFPEHSRESSISIHIPEFQSSVKSALTVINHLHLHQQSSKKEKIYIKYSVINFALEYTYSTHTTTLS